MQKTIEEQYLFALHYVYPLPINKLQSLIKHITHLSHLRHLSVTEFAHIFQMQQKAAENMKENYLKALQMDFHTFYKTLNISVIPFYDASYPVSLHQLIDPPTMLYIKGNSALLHKSKIACIGSRLATDYTNIALASILPPLLDKDFVIVSGLARGADTMAHKKTIQLGGSTIAVIGHGFSHIYPKENKQLTYKIEKEHLLLSEYPPYIAPRKWTFPMRNRIISGLSEAIIVTEAAMKSGTIITVEHALEHGKDIFVVPGPIHSKQSQGTNNLWKEGAIPVWNGQQILEEMQLFRKIY